MIKQGSDSKFRGPMGRPTRAVTSIKQGRGMCCIIHPTGMKGAGDPDHASIKMKPDGTFDLIIGAVDIGQGMKIVMCQFAAEELDVPLGHIRLTNSDTDTSSVSTGTFASRVTFNAGNAVLLAARDLKRQMCESASKMLQVPAEELTVGGQKVYKKSDPAVAVSMGDLAATATWFRGEFLIGHSAYLWAPPQAMDPETGANNGIQALAYGACVADVEVDTETGVVEIKKLFHAYEIGRAINPLSVEGQIEGGAAMGIGLTLMEDLLPYYPSLDYHPLQYADYVIPTIKDVPDMVNSILENPDPDGPYGAKGFSEMTCSPQAAAVINAIHDAVGIWIDSIPVTPEKVLRALEAKN